MFVKVRFVSRQYGATAGLVFRETDARKMPIGELSRRFPPSEALKMQRVELSPAFATWDEAFAYRFPE